MKREDIFKLIEKERERQNKLHPNDSTFERDAPLVLGEEIGEVHKAILEQDFLNLHDELVQVAAVAVRWLESFE